MLTFHKEKDLFIVTEQRLSFNQARIMTVRYTSDLLWKQVDNEPWNLTTKDDRDWFNKYYAHKF